MSFFTRLFGGREPRDALQPLYRMVVTRARDPQWYTQGAVPDTQDGRFDMIAAILALILLRLENEGDAFGPQSALLAELFVEDMDGQLRELGVGDIVVGKHIGKMMGALGGRLAAYRDGFKSDGDARESLLRNLYRGTEPDDDAVNYSVTRLEQFSAALAETPGADIIAGTVPELP